MVDYRFLIQQAASILLAVAYPWLAAKKDAMQIIANGSLDSLKTDWHKVNAWIRVTAFGCLGIAADVQHPLLALSYFLFAAAIFWLLFDYRLNILRGLEPGYVGANADADALIKWLAQHFKYTLEEAGRRIKWLCFGLTSAAYLASCYWVLS